MALANIEDPKISYLNLSYAKMITDEGLNAFEGKEFPIENLILTGLTGVTGKGLYHPIMDCRASIRDYSGGLMDQEEMKVADFGKALGSCWTIETIDLSFNKALTDEFFMHFMGQEKEDMDGVKRKVGLSKLHTCKLNYLQHLNDQSIKKVLDMCPALESLELTGCELLTEYFIETMFKSF
jgi:hypothetical protein